jgi:hypothetical protein
MEVQSTSLLQVKNALPQRWEEHFFFRLFFIVDSVVFINQTQ